MIDLLSPARAQDSGYRVVDVREYPEYAAGAISGSEPGPLAKIEEAAKNWDRDQPLLLVCRSGKRAALAAAKLETLGFRQLAILEGGVDAWRAAGLPLLESQKRPWSLERQVRAIAGSMVLLSTVGGLTLSGWFYGLTLFVGAGLVFAGVSDICLMATVLGRMPWNQRPKGLTCPPSTVRE